MGAIHNKEQFIHMFVEYDVENDKKVISELIVIIGFILNDNCDDKD